jgi:hypothetical protein
MSIIQTLTEGMVNRNMEREGAALLNKWSQTGLLEGLSKDEQKASMARLLENQARELLRESNTMAGGDVEGFAAVAFPIVRRVFAGLIANDLVSVQPMSLPSGLIFFLDFSFGNELGGEASNGRLGAEAGRSIYGQGVLASEVTGGVQLNSSTMDQQPYGLGAAYSSPTGSFAGHENSVLTSLAVDATYNGTADIITDPTDSAGQALLKEIEYDADVIADFGSNAGGTGYLLKVTVDKSDIETTETKINMKQLSQIHAPLLSLAVANDNIDATGALKFKQIRRLTKESGGVISFYYVAASSITATNATVDFLSAANITSAAATTLGSADDAFVATLVHSSYPQEDTFRAGSNTDLGAIRGGAEWALEGAEEIPEIDIKVDSIAITAVTKKLKAKWTPELGQDLNAYHNLDAEVELTSILSEQIALEIDREILQDLIKGATAGTFYWSRNPGMFVNRLTGAEVGANTTAPDFTGTVSEWYETLIETINDVSAQIHRKTLRGGANFVVLSPEVANILEFTAGFRANVTADADKGDIGAVKVGSLNRKFDVIVDPYFPRNAILVGRKGSSFLESGYVYAPYVPLQTTPTIFGPEDFVPRKGVMTRYGKKMVRPDMYGLVVVRDLLGAEGGSNQ